MVNSQHANLPSFDDLQIKRLATYSYERTSSIISFVIPTAKPKISSILLLSGILRGGDAPASHGAGIADQRDQAGTVRNL
jgi:hypothetical protein